MADNRCMDRSETEFAIGGAEPMWIYPDRLRKLLEFTGMSCSMLAKKSGVPEATVRKVLQGETKDPRLSTIVPIMRAAEADANILLGLAPPRDYEKELSREGTLLADALRKQIESLQARAEDDDRKMVRLREMVLEKGEAKAVAESRVKSLEFMVDKRDQTIREQVETIAQQECRLEMKRSRIEDLGAKVSALATTVEAKDVELKAVRQSRERRNRACRRLFAALCVSVILLVSVSVYAAWEIANIDKGRTAVELEQYIEKHFGDQYDLP